MRKFIHTPASICAPNEKPRLAHAIAFYDLDDGNARPGHIGIVEDEALAQFVVDACNAAEKAKAVTWDDIRTLPSVRPETRPELP